MEWISVNDRLPEKTNRYLVTELFNGNWIVCIAHWCSGYNEFIDQYDVVYGEDDWEPFFRDSRNGITAWMPMPKPYDK